MQGCPCCLLVVSYFFVKGKVWKIWAQQTRSGEKMKESLRRKQKRLSQRIGRMRSRKVYIAEVEGKLVSTWWCFKRLSRIVTGFQSYIVRASFLKPFCEGYTVIQQRILHYSIFNKCFGCDSCSSHFFKKRLSILDKRALDKKRADLHHLIRSIGDNWWPDSKFLQKTPQQHLQWPWLNGSLIKLQTMSSRHRTR